jgi:hypothetical protein
MRKLNAIHAVQSLDDETDMYVWRGCDPTASQGELFEGPDDPSWPSL